jgi:hypothetical protein
MNSVKRLLMRSSASIGSIQILGIYLMASFLATSTWADNLVSRVDRANIGLNETLNLVLEYDERVESRNLDFTSLQQDFEILNNSTTSQVSIINGRQDVSTRWTLILLPKRSGQLVIPSFQIDGNFSEAISLDVSENNVAGARGQPLNAELEVSQESILNMQQLLVTVRLIAASQISNLSGDSLQIQGAEVTLLDQQQFTQAQNGVTWQIVEFVYAVFADQPGTLEIPAQLFSGVIGSTRSVFDPFGGSGQRILARSPAATVLVESADSQQNWFPAEDVQIEAEWPGLDGATGFTQIRVGEPITRSLSVIAYSQRPETIPPLPSPANDQFKVYADQPELLVQTSADKLIGIRRESAAIVPTVAGEMTLPEIRIPWWDTNDSAWKEAILPAQTINILEAEITESLAPPESFAIENADSDLTVSSTTYSDPIWIWISATMTFMSLILGWLLWRARSTPNLAREIESANTAEKVLWAQLLKDLKHSNAVVLRTSIEYWCRSLWPEESGSALHNLKQRLSGEAAKELMLLEKSVYGKEGTEAPNLIELPIELKKLRKSGSKNRSESAALPPLYPESN